MAARKKRKTTKRRKSTKNKGYGGVGNSNVGSRFINTYDFNIEDWSKRMEG